MLWARRFEVGATEKVWVHLDFVDDSRTFDQSDKAIGMCFAYVERAARRGCRTSVALRSQDPTWSHKILKGLMKTPESRQCRGRLLHWDPPCLGLVMIWVSQEVCDVLEVMQEGSRCDYRSKITHAFVTWLHDGAANPKPMWTRVGVWGNTLVRASDVQENRYMEGGATLQITSVPSGVA